MEGREELELNEGWTKNGTLLSTHVVTRACTHARHLLGEAFPGKTFQTHTRTLTEFLLSWGY